MADFDPSPRSTKRPRTGTYKGNRTVLGSSSKSSRQSNVSSAFSSISQRLFGSSQTEKEPEPDHDSAYASKEDSLNEEQVEQPQEDDTLEEPEGEAGNKDDTRATRRSTRRSRGGEDQSTAATTPSTKQSNVSGRANGRRVPASESVPQTKRNAQDQEAVVTRQSARKRREIPTMKDEVAEEPKSTQSKLRRRSSPQQSSDTSLDDDNIKQAGNSRSEMPTDLDNPVPRSSGRTTKRPRRLSNGVPSVEYRKPARSRADEVNSTIGSPQPKGILTPSSRKRDGPRKFVVFHENEKQTEEQLGFKDIEVSGKATNSKEAASRKNTEQEISNQPPPEEDDLLLVPGSPEIIQSLHVPQSSMLLDANIEDAFSIMTIKSHILSRLTSRSSTTPTHLESQYNTLHTLLSSTVTAGESNSLLLLGSRGSGKSLLIDNALADLSAKYSNDFHIVKLNGFFQTDDKLALREIWRQLGREMAVDESETGEVMGSYADTMASLLSLLSHSDEMDPEAMHVDNRVGMDRTSKSVIIVLDEFDLFTTHPRQTLLYNLFDIAQSRKAPIAVIGCSTRMDVVECLEKRVKSRFSHRWVHVPSVKSLSAFQEAVECVLCIADDEVVECVNESDRQRWNQHITTSLLPSEPVQTLLASTFHTTKSIPAVLSALYIPIATLSLDATPPSASKPSSKPKSKAKVKSSTPSKDIAQGVKNILASSQPSLITLFPTLPTLHISLLIAATRLESLHLAPTLNFNAIYAHYTQLHHYTRLKSSSTTSGTASSLRTWSKETCRGAWEDLVGWELLVPVNKSQEGKDEGGSDGSRWYRVEVTLEEVAWGVKEKFGQAGGGATGEVLGRWCREEVVGW